MKLRIEWYPNVSLLCLLHLMCTTNAHAPFDRTHILQFLSVRTCTTQPSDTQQSTKSESDLVLMVRPEHMIVSR